MTDYILEGAALDRLQRAARNFGSQRDLADKAGIPATTLSQILKQGGDVSVSRLAKIAQTLGMSIDYILTGAEPVATSDSVAIGLLDIDVSAGPGAATADHSAEEPVHFPRAWIRAIGARISDLSLVRVVGESMVPTLRHGDLAMVDRSRNQIADGIYVLRLNGELCVKRLAVFDAEVQVRSDAYVPRGDATPPKGGWPFAPVVLQGEQLDDKSVIDVIGRVVWAGRMFQ